MDGQFYLEGLAAISRLFPGAPSTPDWNYTVNAL